MSDIPWSSVIKNSFYYSEYHAFQIEEVPEGLVLHGWSKIYDNTASDEGSLFLKPEWIVHLINMIRSVPKDVLRRGEGSDEEAYGGQWYRGGAIPNAEPDGIQISFSARNRYVERGLPILCIRSYAIKPKPDGTKDMDCFIDYPLLEERRDIEISHGDDVEGYIRDVEPVLHELEKYVPEKDKSKILEPIGKIKTELEKEFEYYEDCCQKDKKNLETAQVKWIKKQVGDKDYEITEAVFYNGKIDFQKTIKCHAKEMAMASNYFDVWDYEIETIPYTKSNQLIELEISESSKYKGHKNVKLLIKGQNDFFEIPFTFENSPFYGFLDYTEAKKYKTYYLRKIESLFIDDYFALKWYTEDKRELDEKYSEMFYVPLRHLEQFYHVLTYVFSLLVTKKNLEELNQNMYGSFSFCFDNFVEDGIVNFDIKNEAVHNGHSSISFRCFSEEFAEEFNRLYSLVEKGFAEYFLAKKEYDFKLINWNTYKEWRPDTWYLVWNYEGESEKHEVNLSKEKLYKIQEYAFWWWRATNRDEKYGFEDEKIFFEINPESDRKGLGTVSLKFKEKPEANVTSYFDLSSGCNLPKDFCNHPHNELIRRAKIIENQESSLFFNWWNSKYNDYDEKTEHFFAIDKSESEDFVNVIKELHDFLNNPENKVSGLLDKKIEQKYARKGFWISIWAGSFGLDGNPSLDVDDDIPLHITIYSKCEHIKSDYIPVVGTRHTLVAQLMELMTGLKKQTEELNGTSERT